MSDFLKWLGSVIASSAGAAALMTWFTYLARAKISHWLSKDLENAKAAHQKELEGVKGALVQQIERLKFDLQRVSTEHSVRFTKLHEKRAVVIATLYSLLVKTLWAAEGLLNPLELPGEPTKAEKAVTAQNSIARTYRFFDRHRIYLPPDVCDSLDKMLKEIRSPVVHFTVFLRYDEDAMMDHTASQKMEAWMKGHETLTKQIPLARQLLEAEFRKLLGDHPA